MDKKRKLYFHFCPFKTYWEILSKIYDRTKENQKEKKIIKNRIVLGFGFYCPG